MKLRTYQEEIINLTRKAFLENQKRPLIELPCGAGKTVCFAYMAREHTKKENNNVWFLVHRRELINQTIETFNKFDIPIKNIYIGTIQSRKRPETPPTLIIFDEAHHATANTWKKIIDEYPSVPVVGLTATPLRNDNRPLGNVFDVLIRGVDAEYLIANKFLSEYDYFAPEMVNFVAKGKDFDLDEVTETLLESKIVGDIAKYIDFNKKTIIYSPSVKFSKQLEEDYKGVVHFDANTPKEERDEIIEKFRKGEITVLSNVDLIGEGFDVPDCEVVILLRPTMSLSLYIQQSMRALRYKEGKRAKIYDLVGNIYRHNFPTIKREYSLEKGFISKGEKDFYVRSCNSCLKVYEGLNRTCPYCGFDNGKDRREIEIEKEKELKEIKEIQVVERKKAYKLSDLIEIGKQRGYKNPYYWAKMVMKGRSKV